MSDENKVAHGLHPQKLGLDPKNWLGIEAVLKTRFVDAAKSSGYSVKWDSKGKPILTPGPLAEGTIWI